jgi:hypothetical protein
LSHGLRNIVYDQRLEAFSGERNGINADGKLRDVVTAVGRRDGIALQSCLFLPGIDMNVGQHLA